MPLLDVVVVLIIVGMLLWLVNRFLPMESTVKSILNAVVLWILSMFLPIGHLSTIRVGH